jgi:hypothetical protein
MRPLVTTTGSLALAALAMAPAASAWTPPRQLGPAAQAPIYAADHQGRFYALYARARGRGFQLFFDRLGRGGGRGPRERVDTDATAPAGGDYAIAMAPSGRALAVWCTPATSDESPGVYAARRRPGNRFGPPQELAPRRASSGVGDTCSVDAAAGTGGSFVAAWRFTGSVGNRLEAATLGSGESRFGAAQELDARARGRRVPTETAVDASGRATVAWLIRGRVFAARQRTAGGRFAISAVPGRACDFGPRPIRLAGAASGRSVILFGSCAGRGHALRLSRAAPGAPFARGKRLVRTRYEESRLVLNRSGDLLVTWRTGRGHLIAGRGSARRGVKRRQRLTPRGRTLYRPRIDTHSTAISRSGRAIVAWRQRSLRRRASVRIRISKANRRFRRRVTAFSAAGASGVDVTMNVRGDAAVAWNRPARGRRGVTDRILAVTRRRGRRFERRPEAIVRGTVEPVGLLASRSSLLMTWVTQPGLRAVSSVGRFRGR